MEWDQASGGSTDPEPPVTETPDFPRPELPSGKTEGRYRVLFENSPLSLWEEDWTEVGRYLDELPAADLRSHFAAHPEAILECVRRVRVVDVNQATLDLLRAKDKPELLGNLELLFAPASLETFRDEVLALAGGSRHFEAESVHRTLTGEIIEVAVYLSAVPNGGMGTVLVSLLDITDRKRAEAALRRERETLRQILEFQEHERRLVGYEIHDGLAQQLAGAVFFFQSFRGQQVQESAGVWETFDAGLQALREAMTESRRLIDDLRPMALEESGIGMAVENLVVQMRVRWGMEIELVYGLPSRRFAPTLEAAVFRIVQEGLTNVRKHSRSDKARIELTEQGNQIRIEVRDWGTGFDLRQVPAGHYGLEGIRERARLLGGQAAIESAPGEGTRITVELPIARAS